MINITRRHEIEDLLRIQKMTDHGQLKIIGKLCNTGISLQFANENLAKTFLYLMAL